jgi:tetratricopeptide (TPR) repeat protein
VADCLLARFEQAIVGFADRGDVQQAMVLYSTIEREHPHYENLGWVHYQHGRAALILDRVDVAEQSFHRALFSPSSVPALTAFCYERLGYIAFYEGRQPRQAETLLTKALHTYPTSEPRLWLVHIHLLRSRVLAEIAPEQALAAARSAQRVATEEGNHARGALAESTFALGELLFRCGRRSEASNTLQTFLQMEKTPRGLDVTWARAYEMLAETAYDSGRYDQALTAYENVLTFNPYHPWEEALHIRIARCHYHLRHYTQAISMIETLLSKSDHDADASHDARAYHIMGDSLFALGRYSEAAAIYQQALALAPQSTDAPTLQAAHEQALALQQMPPSIKLLGS